MSWYLIDASSTKKSMQNSKRRTLEKVNLNKGMSLISFAHVHVHWFLKGGQHPIAWYSKLSHLDVKMQYDNYFTQNMYTSIMYDYTYRNANFISIVTLSM